MARKWQRMAAPKRGRISYPKSDDSEDQLVPNKGHFVVYTTDAKRFMVPMEYLSRNVFIELLRLSEEEYGLKRHGGITLPYDYTTLEYVISLVQGRMPQDLEKVLLTSIATCHQLASSSSNAQVQNYQQQLIFRY